MRASDSQARDMSPSRVVKEIARPNPYTTTAAQSFKQVEYATALLRKILQRVGSISRRLQRAELLPPCIPVRSILIVCSGGRVRLRGLPPDCEDSDVFLAPERVKE